MFRCGRVRSYIAHVWVVWVLGHRHMRVTTRLTTTQVKERSCEDRDSCGTNGDSGNSASREAGRVICGSGCSGGGCSGGRCGGR